MRLSPRAAVEDLVLLAAVGDDLDLAHNNIIARDGAVHVSGKGELEFADARGGQRELRAAHAARFDRHRLFRRIVVEGEPVFPLDLKADLAGLAGVVVNRDGERNLVALGERDRKIEVRQRSPETPSGSKSRCPALRKQWKPAWPCATW